MQGASRATTYRTIRSGRVHLCVDPLELAYARDLRDLPARPVTALAQDSRGYLWVGTQNGPLLFDGQIISAPPSLAALHDNIVRCYSFVNEHALWIGTIGK